MKIRTRFKHDVIFEFLPEHDKKDFIAWDNIYDSSDGNIVVVYRAPLDKYMFIPMSDYKIKYLELSRDNKINDLLDENRKNTHYIKSIKPQG